MSAEFNVVDSRLTTGMARTPSALHWLALGTFAIGTEGFMIAALLVTIGADLRISIARAGLLVSIFTFAYATSSPLLTTLTTRMDRRRLLIWSMSFFAMFNLLAAMAHTFLALAAARALLAFAAGLYTPNANALAGAIVPAEQRGRAIAIVNGGLTAAIALGVPLGAFIGDRLGWHMTFAIVAALAAIASVGLAHGLRRGIGTDLVATSLSDRLRAVRNPCVARAADPAHPDRRHSVSACRALVERVVHVPRILARSGAWWLFAPLCRAAASWVSSAQRASSQRSYCCS
jgi:predicted MFS family arabinose efflux permease